ncbi:hypothetical protein GCM10027081_41460 [Cupriavidus yeoncheonensis]
MSPVRHVGLRGHGGGMHHLRTDGSLREAARQQRNPFDGGAMAPGMDGGIGRTVRVVWRKYIEALVAGITDSFEQTIRRSGWIIEWKDRDSSLAFLDASR